MPSFFQEVIAVPPGTTTIPRPRPVRYSTGPPISYASAPVRPSIRARLPFLADTSHRLQGRTAMEVASDIEDSNKLTRTPVIHSWTGLSWWVPQSKSQTGFDMETSLHVFGRRSSSINGPSSTSPKSSAKSTHTQGWALFAPTNMRLDKFSRCLPATKSPLRGRHQFFEVRGSD